MIYPQWFMEELRQRVAVSAVVGRRVSLKRHGREFSGLCPFHKEKTPSFTVNDEKGFYHCFGCGSHGDAIGFLKEYERLSYREAIERLAAEAGLSLPEPSAREAEKQEERQGLQQVCERACQWFQAQLASEAGHVARAYLAQRGVSQGAIERFRIGFAPDSSDAMIRALKSQNISEGQMLDAGLIGKPDDGRSAYARFRGRLIFPIRDARSRVVAFGGRILPGIGNQEAAKYLNSPETELFKKGQMLFNYDLARRPASEQGAVWVCEGYMDVVALDQAGAHHAVAPLGTAITPEQLQLLWRLSDAPALCLDGDAAGARAMRRAAELALPLLTPGKTLAFIRLPQGDDPDSLVRREGAQSIAQLAAQAPTLADVLWQQASATVDHSPEQRAGLEHQLMQMAERIAHPTVKTHFKSFFRDRLRAASRLPHPSEIVAATPLPPLPAAGDMAGQMDRAARACLLRAIACPWLLADATCEEAFACLIFTDTHAAQVQRTLLRLIHEKPELLEEQSQPPLHEVLIKELPTESAQTLSRWLKQDPALKQAAALIATQADPLPAARRGWEQAFAAYHLVQLRAEHAHCEQELAAHYSDEAWAKLQAFQSQIAHVEQQRAQLMQQEMEGEV